MPPTPQPPAPAATPASASLLQCIGWHTGEFFRGWLGDLIERKLGNREASFADLKAKQNAPDPYVIGTNLTTGFAEVFSHERHADMPLLDAVRISMSIPLFFQASTSPSTTARPWGYAWTPPRKSDCSATASPARAPRLICSGLKRPPKARATVYPRKPEFSGKLNLKP